jgi:methionyl-tRNA formyltransferase
MSGDRIVLAGCHEAGAHLLSRIVARGVPISCIVTLSPEQGKQYGVSGYVDLRPFADEHGIPVHTVESYSLSDGSDVAFFQAQRFDLLIQGGWQRLFPVAILRTLRVGAVGVHGSPDFLPKGRGRSPLNWALIEDKRRFIFQYFLIGPGADDGDVFETRQVDITPFDTIRTLYMKNVMVTAQVLEKQIPALLAGTVELTPQLGIPSYSPKRTAEDGRIDWESMDVWAIHNLIRAVTNPYPGALAVIRDREVRIWRAQVFDSRMAFPGSPYGAVVDEFEDWLVINARGGLLLIESYEDA